MNLNQKQTKKRLSLILSLLLIISSVNISSANTKFADVPYTHWASKVIAKWSGEDYNVLQGDSKGNFNPSKGLTLGEFMTIISKTFGYVQKQEAQVTPSWAKESVEKAIAAGILPKTEKIDANKMITRQEAIKYIAVAFGIESSQGNTPFIDDQDIDEQYKGYIKAFYDMGYTTGDSKDKSKAKFNPKANYTRAEAMQVIDNILSDIIDKYTRDQTYEKNIIIRKAGVNLHNIKTKQNIIIAQGVQDSNISMQKVQIGKSLIIYGGKDITVVSDKMIENTIINRPYKSVTLRGIFNTVTVHDKTTVHIIGKAEKIILLGNAKAKLNLEEVVQTKDDKNQTPSKSTKPITGTPGNGGGAGGGGNTGTIGDNPSITVTTKFPTGTLSDSAIDIKYIATPSKGASIKEVTYTINDNFTEYLYYASENENERKGTLGQGRVLLQPGQNNIVFTVTDTAGKSGKYIVDQQLTFSEGTYRPKIKDDELSYLSDGSGKKFANNRISLDIKDKVNRKEVEKVADYLNGEIIGYLPLMGIVTIRVPKNTEYGLKAICNDVKSKYPDIIEGAYIEIYRRFTFDNSVSTNNNQNQNIQNPISKNPPTRDPWWRDKDTFKYWTINNIETPKAWKVYKENPKHNIRVGIIDSRIYNNHPDLNIPNSNISETTSTPDSHGTQVMGIIAAEHDNGIGISGVTNFDRKNYFAYSLEINQDTTDVDILDGFEWNVVRGVKVINLSMGSEEQHGANPTQEIVNRYNSRMQKLLDIGYDYIVVQSAGNRSIDASKNDFFTNVTNSKLVKRIIVVGASNRKNKLYHYSNHGDRVDVVAPGDNVYSTSFIKNDNGEDLYYSYDFGTSFAAPFVTGVAALVWSEKPIFSGEHVKKIIVDSANQTGHLIEDARRKMNNGEDAYKYPRGSYKQVDAETAVKMALGESIKPKDHMMGKLAGLVVTTVEEDNTKKDIPVSDAVIKLYKKTGIKDIEKATEIVSTVSDVQGYYHIDDIIPGDYIFTVEAEGYAIETVNVKIEPWVTTNIHKLIAVKDSNKKGIVKGRVKNSALGIQTSDTITLEFRRGIDTDLSEKAEVIQSENGRYVIELLPGNYTVTAKAKGYITSTNYVVSYGEGITSEDQDIVISPELKQGGSSLRAVLTWGKTPYDLDSHLTGPTPDGNKFHIYYSRKNSYYEDVIYNTLDVDDVDSFGPETVTINKLVDGTYNYYVHDFTNRDVTTSPQLSLSNAVVQVYDNHGKTLKTFNVPVGGKGTVWHVFTLIVKDAKYKIVPVDTINNKYMLSTDNQQGGTRFRSVNTNQEEVLFNTILTQEEKDSKIQSRKQSAIDSDNSDLEVKKDDSDRQGIDQSTANN